MTKEVENAELSDGELSDGELGDRDPLTKLLIRPQRNTLPSSIPSTIPQRATEDFSQ